jgi:PAS domain-containing protein
VPLFWRKPTQAGTPALPPPDQAFLLREIVDGIPDPAAILDGRGQIAAANAALGTLFSRKQCEGRTLLELSRSAELADAAARALGGPVRAQIRLPSSDTVVQASISPVSGATRSWCCAT